MQRIFTKESRGQCEVGRGPGSSSAACRPIPILVLVTNYKTNLSIEKCCNYLFVNSGVKIVLSNKFSDGCGWSPVRLHLSTLAEFLPLAPVCTMCARYSSQSKICGSQDIQRKSYEVFSIIILTGQYFDQGAAT